MRRFEFAVSALIIACIYTSSVTATTTQHGPVGGSTYDYVIVGAGVAGLVVGNRLTEDGRSMCVRLFILPPQNANSCKPRCL